MEWGVGVWGCVGVCACACERAWEVVVVCVLGGGGVKGGWQCGAPSKRCDVFDVAPTWHTDQKRVEEAEGGLASGEASVVEQPGGVARLVGGGGERIGEGGGGSSPTRWYRH